MDKGYRQLVKTCTKVIAGLSVYKGFLRAI